MHRLQETNEVDNNDRHYLPHDTRMRRTEQWNQWDTVHISRSDNRSCDWRYDTNPKRNKIEW